MTGVGAGAIDLVWLMDNIRVAEIDVAATGGDDEDPIYTHGFCLSYKARDAAEDFLLSRYRLFSNVYLHKTTRGFEQLISYFFRIISERLTAGDNVKGLNNDHPLVRFFRQDGQTLENYSALDDSVVLGAMQHISWFGEGVEADISRMLLSRTRPFCLDIQNLFPNDLENQRSFMHKLNQRFKEKIGISIFVDSVKLSIYGEIGADDSRAQKRLMILLSNGKPREITDFNDATIQPSTRQRIFNRYYFLEGEDFNAANDLLA